MVVPFDPFLIASVPGEVAGAVAGAGAVAVAAMWRRIVVLEGQAREDFRAGTEAMQQMIAGGEKLAEELDGAAVRLAGEERADGQWTVAGDRRVRGRDSPGDGAYPGGGRPR